MRVPVTARIGLALVFAAAGVFGGVQRWMDTRVFVAVDAPVSLGAGHIRTGPFPINLQGGYSIWIDLDQNSQFDPMCSSYVVLQTKWVLYRDGRVAERWDETVLHDTYLGGFVAGKGMYDLDVEVLSDATCLNANRPRLKVLTSKTEYELYGTGKAAGVGCVRGWR